MEIPLLIPLQTTSNGQPIKDTYRSTKPPDQCVISYNFQQTNSLNFTHNMLIGMGFDDPKNMKKSQTSPAFKPNKNKLYSIIAQPNKVFREQSGSVSKSYHPNIIPRRYKPVMQGKNQHKQLKSNHQPTKNSRYHEENSKDPKENQNKQKQEKIKIKNKPNIHEKIERENAKRRSPYKQLLGENDHKNISLEKPKNTSNYNQKRQPAEINRKQRNYISNPKRSDQSNDKSNVNSGIKNKNHSLSSKNRPLVNKYVQREQKQNKQNQSPVSNLKKPAFNPKYNTFKQNSLSEQDQSLENTTSKNNPKDIKENNTCLDDNVQNSLKVINEQLRSNNHMESDTKIKSKKEIQDEQLQQLQTRIRSEEGNKLKQFRVKTNQNQKEILPFQSNIEPMFSNKQAKISKKGAHVKSNQNQNSLKGKGSNSFSHLEKKEKINHIPNPKEVENNQENYTSKLKKKPSNTPSLLQNSTKKAVQKEKGNLQPKDSSKKEANNKNISKNKEQVEDLTKDHQIKGFKIPQNTITPRLNPSYPNLDKSQGKEKLNKLDYKPKLSPNRNKMEDLSSNPRNSSHKGKRSDKNQIDSINNQKFIKNAPLTANSPRNTRNKDINSKEWRQSELQKVNKQKRQLQKRPQSNRQKDQRVNSQAKKPQPNLRKQKKSSVIDIDSQVEDKFGLFSKKKPSATKNTKVVAQKKQLKKQKIKSEDQIVQQQNEEVQQNLNQQQQTKNQYQNQQPAELKKQQRLKQSIKITNKMSKQGDSKDAEQKIDQSLEQKVSSIRSESDEQYNPVQKQDNKLILNNQAKENLEELMKATQFSYPSKVQPLRSEIETALQNQLQKQMTQNRQIECEHQQIQKQQRQNEVQTYYPVNLQQADRNTKEIGFKNENANLNKQTQDNEQKLNNAFQQSIEGDNIQEKTNIQGNNHKNEQLFPMVLQNNEQDKRQNQHQHQHNITVNNTANRSEDFFQYNIKQHSKINESINQTINMTKYEHFDKDPSSYTRAPILSFIYEARNQFNKIKESFKPSINRVVVSRQSALNKGNQDQIVDQAINILLSIDSWIIERIFEPYQNQHGQIGVWLYFRGIWKLLLSPKNNSFRAIIKQSLERLFLQNNEQKSLETVLRAISGVRVMKLKSTKKKVFSELQFSGKKGHVLKAVTSKDSKWGQRLFEVVKVEVTKQQQNVIQIKQNSDVFWVKQQKFKQIFQHFILICTRQSHFWTSKLLHNKASHKAVITLSSIVATHGSITLFYPSELKSSLLLYKQMQSKVMKFMGKIQQKNNQNGNLYFQFRLQGTYYLFLQTPCDCEIAIESTTQLIVGAPQYIISQTLKNQQCQYVEINKNNKTQEKGRSREKESFRNVDTLDKLRQKFINLLTSK